jgi:hypothetical protein
MNQPTNKFDVPTGDSNAARLLAAFWESPGGPTRYPSEILRPSNRADEVLCLPIMPSERSTDGDRRAK